MKKYDVIIVGGGAAGLMCAATAAKRGRSVIVLDHANKVGKKILMSGGGRCNFTNMYVEPANYISNNPHFCKSALSRYTQWDFIELVNKYNIPYHEKTQGQLFCDNKSSDILNMLVRECDANGVKIQTSCTINQIAAQQADGDSASATGYTLKTTLDDFFCESLVIACGGYSIPTMGATGFGFEIAKQFGLNVLETRASLVPFTITDKTKNVCEALAGVSLPVEVVCNRSSFKEALLFTHRGLSGPAILQISNYWQVGDTIVVDFLPNENLAELIENWRSSGEKQGIKNLLNRLLPKRFINLWLDDLPHDKPLAELSKKHIQALVEAIHNWKIVPSGTEGYRTAEVTLGGVDTSEVSSKSFEAKKAPGMYFVGEVLDVTGWLGGFNFQWAWSSGACAGLVV